MNLDEAAQGVEEMCEIWKKLADKVDNRRFQFTLDNLNHYVTAVRDTRNKMMKCFEEKTGRQYRLARTTDILY